MGAVVQKANKQSPYTTRTLHHDQEKLIPDSYFVVRYYIFGSGLFMKCTESDCFTRTWSRWCHFF